jgi:hypothetical protein
VINVIPGLLVVCMSMLVAVAGLTLVHHLVPSATRKQYNDVAGFIYLSWASPTPCCWAS